jgi:NADPH:quinone reductase-like Zn-dependent oxidoreductase
MFQGSFWKVVASRPAIKYSDSSVFQARPERMRSLFQHPRVELAAKPARLDHREAAAVPLAALTAWQALFDHARLEAGQTVLIHAAAGGVGHFAVQLAVDTARHRRLWPICSEDARRALLG